jgi:hypothetical protein
VHDSEREEIGSLEREEKEERDKEDFESAFRTYLSQT